MKNGTRSGDPTLGGDWFENTGGVTLSTAGQSAGPWAQPALGTFGNIGRDTFRGPKLFNTDMTVFKDFAITERTKAQFQAQFYNVFNHVNFDLPNTTVDASNGGSINNIAYGTQMRALTFALKLNF